MKPAFDPTVMREALKFAALSIRKASRASAISGPLPPTSKRCDIGQLAIQFFRVVTHDVGASQGNAVFEGYRHQHGLATGGDDGDRPRCASSSSLVGLRWSSSSVRVSMARARGFE